MCEGQMENAGTLRGVEMDRQTDLTLDLDGRKVARASLSILRWYGIDSTVQLSMPASRVKKYITGLYHMILCHSTRGAGVLYFL